jgi:hypothetical protein
MCLIGDAVCWTVQIWNAADTVAQVVIEIHAQFARRVGQRLERVLRPHPRRAARPKAVTVIFSMQSFH